MKYTDVCVDLETLGVNTDRRTVIVSIGAVAFNPLEQDSYADLTEERCFYAPLGMECQLENGLKISASTIRWWMEQSTLAKRVFQETPIPPEEAFRDFIKFIKNHKAIYLWGNGNTFDNMILRNAFEAYGLGDMFPIFWTKDMDLRTLKRVAGGMKDFITERGIEHHALDDAKYEVLVIQEAFRRLNGTEAGNSIHSQYS